METIENLFTALNEAVINEREISVGMDCNNNKMSSIFIPGECFLSKNKKELYIGTSDNSESVIHITMIEDISFNECENMYEIKSDSVWFTIILI